MLPQINAYGVFTVLPPFTIDSVNYTCTAITLISTLLERNVDVFATVYQPKGLTNDQYLADLNNHVSIVTLESKDGPTLELPNTYIANVPVQLAVPYSRLVLSIELGELPDALDLTQLQADLLTITNNYVGVNSTPKLHRIPVNKSYSHQEHLVKEAIRLQNVAAYESFYTGKVLSDNQVDALKAKIRMLEQVVVYLNSIVIP